jgi:hypothetical protein
MLPQPQTRVYSVKLFYNQEHSVGMLMPRINMLNRLQVISERASKIRPVTNAEIASMNLLVGVIYSLQQAAKLDYDDNRANPDPRISTQEFRHSVIKMSQGVTPDVAWLAGYYLNSAILRLAPLNERINKHSHTEYDITDVRRLNNKIKHEPEAQMGAEWHITLGDVVDASDILCKRLEDLLSKE